jgi:hypothetical protein
MKNALSLTGVGHTCSLFLAITFILCVCFDLLLPELAMYQGWQELLPGFEWISWKSFIIGLLWSYAYGWYFSLVWVPLYNYFNISQQAPAP